MKYLRLLIAALAILLTIGLIGCTTSPDTESTTSPASDADTPTESTSDDGETTAEATETTAEATETTVEVTEPVEVTADVTEPTETTATAPEEDTTVASDDETTGVTETETEPETETETEEETDPPFIPTTYEEHLAEIYRKAGSHRVEIGGFLTPIDYHYTEAALRNAREAGLTFMVTQNEFYGTLVLANTLRVADELGMDINLWTFGPHVYDASTTVAKLRQCIDHPCIKYLYLYDEPVLESMSGLQEVRNSIVRAYGSTVNWKLGGNMYPYPSLDQPGQHPWNQTAESFLKNVKADYISFDLYPWVDQGGTLAEFLTNLAMEKALCDKYGAEMWVYLQTSIGSGQTLPSEGQLRYQINAALAMGADALMCYTATEHRSPAILKEDGTPSGMFETAKSVFNDIHAMGGVFLPYDCEGMIIRGQDNIKNVMAGKGVTLVMEDGAWESMASVDGKNFLIGCMRKEDGTTGLYVVNADHKASQTITLHLAGEHTYQLWNRKGLEVMGTTDTLVLDLIPGDGCFVALDVSLDATTYPEPPKAVVVEAPKVVEAEKDSLLFDLGFDDDGKAFNKADSDVYLRSFSGGTVKTIDDRQVLTKYSIYTCDIKDVATNGITVEMYIQLHKNANKTNLTLFADLWGNGNLHRFFAPNATVHYFHGAYDGNDVMLKDGVDQLLPTETWLHIVAVSSEEGQYVYVNGQLISEGHFGHTPAEYGSFVFNDDSRGVAYLAEARIYSYAADEAQVAQMYENVK